MASIRFCFNGRLRHNQEEAKGTVDSELAVVLSSISLACKKIGSLVQRAGLANMTGLAGEVNVQGEDQKKLDVISNDIFCACLKSSGRTVRTPHVSWWPYFCSVYG